jgi:hypothetical protein
MVKRLWLAGFEGLGEDRGMVEVKVCAEVVTVAFGAS